MAVYKVLISHLSALWVRFMLFNYVSTKNPLGAGTLQNIICEEGTLLLKTHLSSEHTQADVLFFDWSVNTCQGLEQLLTWPSLQSSRHMPCETHLVVQITCSVRQKDK